MGISYKYHNHILVRLFFGIWHRDTHTQFCRDITEFYITEYTNDIMLSILSIIISNNNIHNVLSVFCLFFFLMEWIMVIWGFFNSLQRFSYVTFSCHRATPNCCATSSFIIMAVVVQTWGSTTPSLRRFNTSHNSWFFGDFLGYLILFVDNPRPQNLQLSVGSIFDWRPKLCLWGSRQIDCQV